MSCSARTIVELNIRHYRELLKTETDPAKRRTIATLLAEEEAKLGRMRRPDTDAGKPGGRGQSGQ